MIGIISDTHDNLPAVRKVVRYLNALEPELVIHAGDYIAPFTAIELKNLNARMVGVFGNNDGEKDGLQKQLPGLAERLEFEHRGKRFAVYHGTQESVVDELLKSKKYDVVVRGHNHNTQIEDVDGTLLINPGEVCGYQTRKRTLCLLDVEKMHAEIKEF
jgi:putative phosphoesterase